MLGSVLNRFLWDLADFPGSVGGFRFVFLERSKKQNSFRFFGQVKKRNDCFAFLCVVLVLSWRLAAFLCVWWCFRVVFCGFWGVSRVLWGDFV